LGKTVWVKNGKEEPFTKIVVNKKIANNDDLLRQTLAHEIIHHHLYQKYGNEVAKHGEHFNLIADRINNKEGDNFVSQFADKTDFKPNAESKLIVALRKTIILADFKTVKTKFLDQGIADDEVDSYLEDFKILRDRNKIKNIDEKNIDYWGGKVWEVFKKFVDDLKGTKTRTEEKKLTKMEGAKLLAENKLWSVYQITTHEASKLYGSGTRWCLTTDNDKEFVEYLANSNIYYIISKTKPSTDPWYKIALLVDSRGTKTYWNALDAPYGDLPKGINFNIPKFKMEKHG